MPNIPTGATLTILSDGNTPNAGRYLAQLSGTYTAGTVVLDTTSYPAASKTGFGIKPNFVKVTNLTDRISMEAAYGSVSGLHTAANGTRTYTTHGMTLAERSLTIPATITAGGSTTTNDVLSNNATVLVEVWA